MRWVTWCAKAIVAAGGLAGTALADGHVTPAEAVGIIVGAALVFAVPNGPKPTT